MRRFLIAGNWKMHKGVGETSAFIEGLLASRSLTDGGCRRRPSLHLAADRRHAPDRLLDRSRRSERPLGDERGLHRRDFGRRCCASSALEWVIVGHSERRTLFGETDRTARDRARAAQAGGPQGHLLHRRDPRGAGVRPDLRGSREPDRWSRRPRPRRVGHRL